MDNTVWFSCGVVKKELLALESQGLLSGQFLFMDSMLHMDPPRLEKALSAFLPKIGAKTCQVVIVYGDCCARMLDLVRDYRVARVDAINCAQLLVGRSRYRELMKGEAYMLLPEWALRWREIFQGELGLDEETARSLMGEHRKEIVYLDTGLAPVPEAELQACARYTGLPWRSERTGLTSLLELLLAAEKTVLPGLSDA